MTKKPNTKFYLENQELASRLESLNPRIKLEAEREAKLNRRANHSNQPFFIKSKFTKRVKTVPVPRGKLCTNYNELAKLWLCSRDQARRLIKKWKKQGKVTVIRIKDQRNFDLGILITYNPLFNQLNQSRQKRAKKTATRESTHKSLKLKVKKIEKSKTATHNKEVLHKCNIHKKDVVIFDKLKKEFSKIGINPIVQEQILKDNDSKTIQKYLDLLNLNSDKIKNKAAWFVSALRQRYDLLQVDNWYKDQEQKKEAQKRREEVKKLEELKRQEEFKKVQEENKLIDNWRLKNGTDKETQLYLKAFEEFKKSNRIIYSYLIKKHKENQDLVDLLKSDCFVKAKVRGWILEEIKSVSNLPTYSYKA